MGILTPDWLTNATYLGTDTVDTYDTHVWTKAEGFIKYWADTKTGHCCMMAHMCALAGDCQGALSMRSPVCYVFSSLCRAVRLGQAPTCGEF